jgi:hypothetical protein
MLSYNRGKGKVPEVKRGKMSTTYDVYDDGGVMDPSIAFLLLNRQVEVAARCALGDGLSPEEVYDSLRQIADAIRQPGDVAEDMSAISVPME